MIPLSLDEVAGLDIGELAVREGAAEITGVQVDSRRVSNGDLFVAVGLGDQFLEDALERGAAATLVPRDAFAAMAALGRAVRARSQARVVAITGSYGKTTTKDILASIAIPQRPTVAAERSFSRAARKLPVSFWKSTASRWKIIRPVNPSSAAFPARHTSARTARATS